MKEINASIDPFDKAITQMNERPPTDSNQDNKSTISLSLQTSSELITGESKPSSNLTFDKSVQENQEKPDLNERPTKKRKRLLSFQSYKIKKLRRITKGLHKFKCIGTKNKLYK
jgi:hypothetical protein